MIVTAFLESDPARVFRKASQSFVASIIALIALLPAELAPEAVNSLVVV